MYKIGFIGFGNMGYAITKGILKTLDKSEIAFFDIDTNKCASICEELDISLCSDNIEIAKSAKYVILAIKPQVYDSCLEEIREHLSKDAVVISIAPGINISRLKEIFKSDTKVVRVMPNTPSLVGEGMSVISFSDDEFSEAEIKDIESVFESCGEIEIIDEKFMDAVVPISGSSPAYVYMMIEALSDGGVLLGLPRSLSYKLAAQAVKGAAEMVLSTQTHPGELKDAVCSPGGTTIEAVSELEKNGFRSSLIEAMKAAYEKTQKLK